ncbi:MAG: rRNA maturation RNase YbeY [Wenzhouxiangellaceae bacterium]|nr:rRNA maturation RNase YbeY [Wenzhouxiangellaceae bacterium]
MSVEIQRCIELAGIPGDPALRSFVEAALPADRGGEICLRVVDEAEGRALNLKWRGKDYATNVLSFPASLPPGLPVDQAPELVGDIVLCAPVIAREAELQGKQLDHHWAHLVVHGVLHLIGFDHTDPATAARMEQTERDCLARMDMPDPYQEAPGAAN